MQMIAGALRDHPELALFLTLAVGHALGRVHVGPLRMNPVLGVLVAGLLVGQIGIEVPAMLQGTFFVLFLFSSGFKSGPQFFRSLGKDSLPHLALALLLCGSSFALSLYLARFLGLDAGGAAGLFAGSLNSSTTVGTAGDAIARLAIEPEARRALAASLSVVFAVTYVVGLVVEIGTLTGLGPWLMRVDLAAECRKLETELGVVRSEAGVVSAYRELRARAYRIPEGLHGGSVRELERSFAPARAFVVRVRTAEGILDAEPGTPLRPGDVVVISGRSAFLVDPTNPLNGHEVEDRELVNIPVISVDVVLTRTKLTHRTMAAIAETAVDEGLGHSVFVMKVTRAGEPIPMGPGTVVERGDVLTLSGPRTDVARVAERLGAAQWPSIATDMITVAAVIAIGGLLGLPTVKLFGVDVGLTLSVGVLFGGLLVGWLRSLRPVFGRVPDPVLWVFDSLGLTGFLAIVGINAGPGFVHGLKTAGFSLILAAALVRLLPNVVTILVGRYAFRMHPGVLLGVCAGAGSSSSALAAVNDRADSQIPTLGFGVSYAVGTMLLAIAGTILVVAMR